MDPGATGPDASPEARAASPRGGRPAALSPGQVVAQQRQVLIRLVRLGFLVLFATVTILAILDTDALGQGILGPGGIALKTGWSTVVVIALLLSGVVATIDALTTRRKISTLAGIFLGLLVALLATYALGRVFDLLAEVYDIRDAGLVFTVKTLLGIGLSYLCIATVLQTQDDFRLVIPYVEFAKQIRGPRPLIVDSSALIDARLADLAATGIIQAPLIVPAFVVGELQLLADSSDKLRRVKGRRGLDVVARLQRTPGLDVSIDETSVPGKAVDQLVVEVAREMQGVVLTTDTGLARVASIQGVRTLNINDIAAAVKPALVAGEQITLMLAKPGEQPGQAVGYLDDGTMVVAEDGRPWIGRSVPLTVVSTLQTSAGRLVFARVSPAGDDADASVRGEGNGPGMMPSVAPARAVVRPADGPGPEAISPARDVAGEPATGPMPASGSTGLPARPAPAIGPMVGPIGGQVGGPSAVEPGDDEPGAEQRGEGDRPRGPFPPKPPKKRFNSLRNPRR